MPFATQDSQTPQKMTWSRLLKRVFKIDVTQCLACGAKLNPENCAIITDPQIVAAILAALGMNARPPQRGPPRRQRGLFDAATDTDTDTDIDQRQTDYDD